MFIKFSPMSLLLLVTVFTTVLFNTANSMLRSPFEQQDKFPQFLTILLQPTSGAGTAKPDFNRQLQPKLPPQQQEQRPTVDDYYDAVRLEDEEEQQQQRRQQDNQQNHDDTAMLHLFTALQANVDPLSSLIVVDGESMQQRQTNGTNRTIKMESKGEKFNQTGKKDDKSTIIRVDGDTTYNEEKLNPDVGDEALVDGETVANHTTIENAHQKAATVGSTELINRKQENFNGSAKAAGKLAVVDGETGTGSGEEESSSEEAEDGGEKDEKKASAIVDNDTASVKQNGTVDNNGGTNGSQRNNSANGNNANKKKNEQQQKTMPVPPKAKIFTIA